MLRFNSQHRRLREGMSSKSAFGSSPFHFHVTSLEPNGCFLQIQHTPRSSSINLLSVLLSFLCSPQKQKKKKKEKENNTSHNEGHHHSPRPRRPLVQSRSPILRPAHTHPRPLWSGNVVSVPRRVPAVRRGVGNGHLQVRGSEQLRC